jgi:hypothetical protein
MHMPERWGFVQFSDAPAGAPATPFIENRNERVKMQVTDSLYEIRAAGFDNAVVHLRQDGKVWVRLAETRDQP